MIQSLRYTGLLIACRTVILNTDTLKPLEYMQCQKPIYVSSAVHPSFRGWVSVRKPRFGALVDTVNKWQLTSHEYV